MAYSIITVQAKLLPYTDLTADLMLGHNTAGLLMPDTSSITLKRLLDARAYSGA